MGEGRITTEPQPGDSLIADVVNPPPSRVPPAPVVSAFVSGLVLGAVLALLASGVISHAPHAASPVPTLSPPTPTGDSTLHTQLARLVGRQLGAWAANPKAPRLMSLVLVPVPPASPVPEPESVRYRSVIITFHLNDHPLGGAWRARAAKADVFAVMKALYTTQFPVYNVDMRGIFPLGRPGHLKPAVAVIAFMRYSTAVRIPWKTLHRVDEGRLWTMLSHSYINPQFA